MFGGATIGTGGNSSAGFTVFTSSQIGANGTSSPLLVNSPSTFAGRSIHQSIQCSSHLDMAATSEILPPFAGAMSVASPAVFISTVNYTGNVTIGLNSSTFLNVYRYLQ